MKCVHMKGRNMRKRLCIAALAALTWMAAPAAAAVPIITVDEYGNSLGNIAVGPGFLSPDPISGFVTLTYILPFPGNAGDVILIEPSTSQPSDVIRFPGNGRMYFFSEASEGPEPGV